MIKSFIIALVFLVVGVSSTLLTVRSNVENIAEPAFHEHADFALFLNGERFDFSLDEFMSITPCTAKANFLIPVAQAHGLELDEAIDLHDRDGNTVHVHQPGVAWHDFFESLKMGFENNLFVDAEGVQYKSDDAHEFRFIVNGERVDTLADREIRNLDQVLISYGSKDEDPDILQIQYAQVTNNACLFSGACSHRGVAPVESCGAAEVKKPLLQWLGL